MKKGIITTLLATSLGLLANPACGADSAAKSAKKAKGPKQSFAKLDTDGDGVISLDEFKANAKDADKAAKRFAKLDSNKDENLSAEEFNAKPAKKKAAAKPKKKKAPAPTNE